MEIKIELTQAEGIDIIIKHFQPMFPNKIITGEISSYSGIKLEVNEKPIEEKENSDGEK